jgi:hypothetical protein
MVAAAHLLARLVALLDHVVKLFERQRQGRR